MRTLIIFLLICTPTFSADYQKIFDATCYIRSVPEGKTKGVTGSGAVFKIDNKYMYVLTAGHVIVNNHGWLYFLRDGRWTSAISYEVVKKSNTNHIDLAVLRTELKEMIKRKVNIPHPLSIAKKEPRVGQPIISCGFPSTTGTRWMSMWIGRKTGPSSYRTKFKFLPKIEKGRSGSPIVNYNNEIVGVVIQFIPTKNGKSIGMNTNSINSFIPHNGGKSERASRLR